MKKAWKDAKSEQLGFGLREEDCERSINGIIPRYLPALANTQVRQRN